MKEQLNNRSIWLGLIFIMTGGIWLLDNLDIIDFNIPRYLISWKSFLILLGLFMIFVKGKTEPGIVLIAIGGLFLADDVGWFDVRDVWHIFWPVVIIAIGISLIMRRGAFSKGAVGEKKNDIDYIDDFTLFGGREMTVNSQNFKGGKISAMFGGSDIDLRNADLAPGRNVLDIFAMFGGVTVTVPPDWTIHVEVFSLLGGFSDGRASVLKVVPNAEKVLVVTGFVMFGGGEIKLNK